MPLRVDAERSGSEAFFLSLIPDCSRRMVIDPYSGYELVAVYVEVEIVERTNQSY